MTSEKPCVSASRLSIFILGRVFVMEVNAH